MKVLLPDFVDWLNAEQNLRFAEYHFAAAVRDDELSLIELSFRKDILVAARELAHEKFACAMQEMRHKCQGP